MNIYYLSDHSQNNFNCLKRNLFKIKSMQQFIDNINQLSKPLGVGITHTSRQLYEVER